MSGNLSSVAAWSWTGFSGLLGLGLIGQGHGLAGALALTSAAASFPPLWRTLSSKGQVVPVKVRAAIGTAVFFGAAVMTPKQERSSTSAPSLEQLKTASADDLAELLSRAEKKVADHAVLAMEPDQYPKMLSKLGKTKFDEANLLSRWAAVAVARSDACDRVDLVGVSDKSDRKHIVWFIDCANHERFMVTQYQAEDARRAFDRNAPDADRQAAAETALPQPVSAQWKDFDEVMTVSKCDQAVKSTAVNRGSVDTAWKWDVFKNADSGRITIERDFDAKNALGGTISSRYRCVVSSDGKQLLGLSIRQLDGWKEVM